MRTALSALPMRKESNSMKIFIKQSNSPRIESIILFDIVACYILISGAVKNRYPLSIPVLGCLLVMAISMLALWLIRTSGLYFNGCAISYKVLRRKNIDVNDIAGIKVARAVTRGGKYFDDINLTNANGEQLYTMLFVKEYMPWLMGSEKFVDAAGEGLSDLAFRSNFGEYVICSCVYNQIVVDHLLTLNPSIIVF